MSTETFDLIGLYPLYINWPHQSHTLEGFEVSNLVEGYIEVSDLVEGYMLVSTSGVEVA